MVTINVYDKGQVDDLLADKMDKVATTGASEGDVLTLDANLAPVWQATEGGSGRTITYFEFSNANLIAALESLAVGDELHMPGNYLANSNAKRLNWIVLRVENISASGIIWMTGTGVAGTTGSNIGFIHYARLEDSVLWVTFRPTGSTSGDTQTDFNLTNATWSAPSSYGNPFTIKYS